MSNLTHRPGSTLLFLSLVALVGGCGRQQSPLAPRLNAGPPVLSLHATRTLSTGSTTARYALSWQLTSGAADHFVYAINPRSTDDADGSWVATRSTSFSLDVPVRRQASSAAERASLPRTDFAVRAVDASGRMSDVQRIAIINDNIAPSVQITQPVPSDRGQAFVPTTIEIHWQGNDPDGSSSTLPPLYKYIVLSGNSEFPYYIAVTNPDSLRRYYEPRDYAGWTVVNGVGVSAPSVQLTNLVPQADYLFAVVAQDDQGAYTQVFSLDSNMLNMRVLQAGQGGPRLTMFNSYFNYTYPTAAYSTDPSFQVPITISSGQAVTVHWFGEPVVGATISGYRWALDIADVTDNTPRTDENTDFAHWSQRSPNTTSATVGPFGLGESHILYIDATDSNGLKSLGMVRIGTLDKTFARDLLIVDDTRFLVDAISPGTACVRAPVGRWPTAAELDTFLFARGGFPWRCYPAGITTTPGMFAGYSYDTMGTRTAGVPSLATLGMYRHVIWLTDLGGASNTGTASTALRLMTAQGSENALAAFVAGGGHLWAVGGGVTYASLIAYNKLSNDQSSGPGIGTTFSSLPPYSELIPGRFPYDMAGWRSEAKVTTTLYSLSRGLGRFEGRGSNYDRLPPTVELKSSATDPLPPLRSASQFYQGQNSLEYLSMPNAVLSDAGDSDLDSLYSASGALLQPPTVNPTNVAMTIYRPADFPQVIWTGFSLWDFRYQDCLALVDYVLQQEWGLHYVAAPRVPKHGGPISWQPELRRTR